MRRDEWLSQFKDELKQLRPHMGDRLVHTLALIAYDAKEHPRVPHTTNTATQPAKKRAK